jgi:hypothetical protein
MRRFLVLICVTAMLGLLVAVAPAVVRPDANRAEALTACEDTGTGHHTVAQHGPWEAEVSLCAEFLQNGVRPGANVWCHTATSQVPCNWDFRHMHLHNQNTTAIVNQRAYAIGKTNGAFIATPGWANRSQCVTAYSDSPDLYIRFPDGALIGPRSLTWRGSPYNCSDPI